MLNAMMSLRQSKKSGSSKIVSVQSKNYGNAKLRSALRNKSKQVAQAEFDKARVVSEMVINLDGQKFLGPFVHILHDKTQQHYKAIVDGEFMVPTEDQFGGTKAIRGTYGKLEGRQDAYGIEFYVAIEQCQKHMDSWPNGSFTGVGIKSENAHVPIIITATTDQTGVYREVVNSVNHVPLTKQDLHKDWQDMVVDASVLSGPD